MWLLKNKNKDCVFKFRVSSLKVYIECMCYPTIYYNMMLNKKIYHISCSWTYITNIKWMLLLLYSIIFQLLVYKTFHRMQLDICCYLRIVHEGTHIPLWFIIIEIAHVKFLYLLAPVLFFVCACLCTLKLRLLPSQHVLELWSQVLLLKYRSSSGNLYYCIIII